MHVRACARAVVASMVGMPALLMLLPLAVSAIMSFRAVLPMTKVSHPTHMQCVCVCVHIILVTWHQFLASYTHAVCVCVCVCVHIILVTTFVGILRTCSVCVHIILVTWHQFLCSL